MNAEKESGAREEGSGKAGLPVHQAFLRTVKEIKANSMAWLPLRLRASVLTTIRMRDELSLKEKYHAAEEWMSKTDVQKYTQALEETAWRLAPFRSSDFEEQNDAEQVPDGGEKR